MAPSRRRRLPALLDAGEMGFLLSSTCSSFCPNSILSSSSLSSVPSHGTLSLLSADSAVSIAAAPHRWSAPLLPSLRRLLIHHPRRRSEQRKEIGGYRSTTRRVSSPPCLIIKSEQDPGVEEEAPNPSKSPNAEEEEEEEEGGSSSRWVVVPGSEVLGADAPKVVGWEELQLELARLWGLSAALAAARDRKASLAARLESALQENILSWCDCADRAQQSHAQTESIGSICGCS